MSQLDELRQIIVGDNSEQLSALKDRVENVEERTRDVAEVLAPAIDVKMRADDKLVDALKQPISESLKRAIRVEPDVYAEILYPAIAPSIRTAISQAISGMLATINQTIESATTVGGLSARVESMRTGVPYAQLLLRQSLVYRVEHLYLIDRESGLLIAECGTQDQGRMDSDAVSAMFSAIQSFVQDSFSGDDKDRLTDFKVGSHTVWITHGPRAMLACVILGDAPGSLKSRLHDALDLIRTHYNIPLQNFQGDSEGFEDVEQYMQPLLQSELREFDEEPKAKSVQVGPLLVYFLIAVALGYLAWQSFDRRSKLATVNHYISQAPGMLVTNSYWQDSQIKVEGLLDPDAKMPLKLLAEHGISAQKLDLNMTPFRSLEIAMEQRRFELELQTPDGVELIEQGGQLVLQGRAPVEWLLRHERRLRQLGADNRLDSSGLFVARDSLEVYLQRHLNLPQAALQSATLNKLKDTAWIDISLQELQRELSKVPERSE